NGDLEIFDDLGEHRIEIGQSETRCLGREPREIEDIDHERAHAFGAADDLVEIEQDIIRQVAAELVLYRHREQVDLSQRFLQIVRSNGSKLLEVMVAGLQRVIQLLQLGGTFAQTFLGLPPFGDIGESGHKAV